ncbi:50S ribosomal protein L24 [Nibribacter ruber]|uniref:Large ribosomal subunit protein uL24 n=1 Tax=Nibribacter ruber TaxID=2698458 RepID=A0A6P1P2X4_9BACT|nr:50S ribosomal protein L24 [Nibribacter ruber]QHL88733.1 50S ribosomal protein L24 [Nibribacter ruber]
MTKNKLHVKKGDTVKVIAGDDKGKTGTVTTVLVSDQKVIVEGLNLVSKHQKPSAKNPQGGINKVEAPIHASNVMLVEPGTNNATRTGKKLNDGGKLQRYSKKSGNLI